MGALGVRETSRRTRDKARMFGIRVYKATCAHALDNHGLQT